MLRAVGGIVRTFIGLLVIAILGCAGGKDAKDDGEVGGDDTAGGTTVPPTEYDWSGDCPPASGIGANTTWEYEYNEQYEKSNATTGTYSVEVEDRAEDGTLTLVTEVSTEGSNNSFESKTTSQYGCDGTGLWLLATYYEYTVTVYYPYEGWREYTYDAPILLMPASVDVGDSWETVYAGVYVDELGARRATDYIISTEVTGREELTVPAGTFTAMEWSQSWSTGSDTTAWYSNGVGLVASEEADLVEFTP